MESYLVRNRWPSRSSCLAQGAIGDKCYIGSAGCDYQEDVPVGLKLLESTTPAYWADPTESFLTRIKTNCGGRQQRCTHIWAHQRGLVASLTCPGVEDWERLLAHSFAFQSTWRYVDSWAQC